MTKQTGPHTRTGMRTRHHANRWRSEAEAIPEQIPAIPPDVPQIVERLAEVAGPQVVADIGVVVPNVPAILIPVPPAGRGGGGGQSDAGDNLNAKPQNDIKPSHHFSAREKLLHAYQSIQTYLFAFCRYASSFPSIISLCRTTMSASGRHSTGCRHRRIIARPFSITWT